MSSLIWTDSYSNRFGSEILVGVKQERLKGIIGLKVVRPNGVVRRNLKFNNLVMDNAFNQVAMESNASNQHFEAISRTCRFGTGTTPPNASQTDLAARTGSYVTRFTTSSTSVNSGTAPWYNSVTREWTFNPGTVYGNLTEIGFFYGASGPMFSRALILDEEGNPTTLTLLEDEYLYVTYEIRSYVGELTDQSAEVNIGGVDYNVNVRKVGVSSATGVWSPNEKPWISVMRRLGNSPSQMSNTDTDISGTGVNGPGGTDQPYSPNSLVRATKFSWGPTQGNVAGGINQMYVSVGSSPAYGAGFSLFFDKHIPKTSDYSMSLTFETAWGRYVP